MHKAECELCVSGGFFLGGWGVGFVQNGAALKLLPDRQFVSSQPSSTGIFSYFPWPVTTNLDLLLLELSWNSALSETSLSGMFTQKTFNTIVIWMILQCLRNQISKWKTQQMECLQNPLNSFLLLSFLQTSKNTGWFGHILTWNLGDPAGWQS